jgi:hypothetical protein
MRLIFLSALFFYSSIAFAGDTLRKNILVIPYQPMMHLSDADHDIAEESEMDEAKIRAALRTGIVKAINHRAEEVFNVESSGESFVGFSSGDEDLVYHSIGYSQDSTYPARFPSKYKKQDSVLVNKTKKPVAETKYINSVVMDQKLLRDLSTKSGADYFLILNELDIKTHTDDCLNLALKIYRRDIVLHYSVYNSAGKQVYGDVAVSYFPSNSNDVNEVMRKNFPVIADQVVKSLNGVYQ